MPIITQPGAYTDIDAEDYHRAADLLPGPSLSSSGAKKLLSQSPYHYWFDSPLNPNRPPEEDKPHFNIGKAAHDIILLQDRWPDFYHVTPEGFSLSKTKAMPEAIAEYEAAREAGKTILRAQDAETVQMVAAALNANKLVQSLMSKGDAEVTLAWQDDSTGVWLRARPDFMPASVMSGGKVMILPDLKFMAPTHCDPKGFSRAVANFGYHQSLAFYADGIKAVYGHFPTHYLLIPVEKEPPHCVSLYEIPHEDIERGRHQNRQAIQLFADCLAADHWPAYADEPMQVGLPHWARKAIDDCETEETGTAWADAA